MPSDGTQPPETAPAGTVIRLEAAQSQLRDHFLGWQCRLRQLAMREAEGRPTGGMRPEVTVAGETQALGAITVLIHKSDPEETTAEFRHMVRRTHDPAERRKAAVKTLQSAFYQNAREFSDVITALFGPGSEAAARLIAAGQCQLDFEQYSQCYSLPCSVAALAEADPAYQATFWHNSLFTTTLPAGVQILAFIPDWATAETDPPVR